MSASFPFAVPARMLTGIASYGAIAAESVKRPPNVVSICTMGRRGRDKGEFLGEAAGLAVSARGVSENGGYVCVLPGT
jgi:hypothetical protein